MKKNIWILFSILFIQINGQEIELIAGHVLFRHGDRTPISTFPTDPMKENDWPNGFGQLTTEGVEQHHRLGRFFRFRYDSLLNSIYNPREIYVRSTDYDRTLMSVQSNLIGLFPLLNVTSDKIPIQPIPIHTVSTKDDFLLGLNDCPRYEQIENEIYQTDEFKKVDEFYKPFFEKLQIWTNISKITAFNAWDIADTIFVENIYNKTPSWATDDVRKNLTTISDLSFHFLYENDESKTIRGGPIIKNIWTNMFNATRKQIYKKVHLYSAHDTTVSAALSFLRINYPHQPQYASALFVDLFKKNSTFFVKIEYLNVTDSNKTYPYLISGCPSVECPFEIFSSIFQQRFPSDDVQIECSKKISPNGGNDKTLKIVLSIFIVVLGIILFLIFSYLYFRKKERDPPLLSSQTTSEIV